MKRLAVLALSAAVCILVVGCNNEQQVENTVVATPVQAPTATNGQFKTVESKMFSSEKFYHNEKEAEILEALSKFVNSGDYNIVQVSTTYSNAYLTSAQVDYLPNAKGVGNKARVKFLTPKAFYWTERQKELQVLKENNTQKSFKTQTVVLQGFQVASEVWYYEEAEAGK